MKAETEGMVAIVHKPWKTVCEFKHNVEYEDRTVNTFMLEYESEHVTKHLRF